MQRHVAQIADVVAQPAGDPATRPMHQQSDGDTDDQADQHGDDAVAQGLPVRGIGGPDGMLRRLGLQIAQGLECRMADLMQRGHPIHEDGARLLVLPTAGQVGDGLMEFHRFGDDRVLLFQYGFFAIAGE